MNNIKRKLSDIKIKSLMLYAYLYDAVYMWWHESLDELVCCDGRECGCCGETFREHYIQGMRILGFIYNYVIYTIIRIIGLIYDSMFRRITTLNSYQK